ncbi:DUF417 family protein [Klebsiella aerogenes]
MRNTTFDTQIRRLLRKTSGLNVIALRLSVIAIFALFGTYKWFPFEANALHHLLPGTWLGALYPALGVQSLSYALGVVENLTLLALITGFFRPTVEVIGALMVAATGIVTLSLLPQLGRIDSFIIKDVLLVGTGLVLLRHDLLRVLLSRGLARSGSYHSQSPPAGRTSVASPG